MEMFDAIVVGGGPAGATAANDLSKQGFTVALLDRMGRIKPCGGAIPPAAIKDFDIPEEQLVARIDCARMVSPKGKQVDIHIKGGFVGMVDREHFDEWLRERAMSNGTKRFAGTFKAVERPGPKGTVDVVYTDKHDKAEKRLRGRCVIGADGALSAVGKSEVPDADKIKYVFAYHEIAKSPNAGDADYDAKRCDVIYQGKFSPDFYSWVFPHGDTVSIGTGSANKGFSLRQSIKDFREENGYANWETVRTEGAPIPLTPLKRWDNGRDVILAGDAAGIVAPSSGEGIFYAMAGGRRTGEATAEFLKTSNPKAFAMARKKFMREHGNVFRVLDMMQRYWYTTDDRRERFVAICRDKDVQELTFDAYMNKALVKAKPLAHVRIFFKNIAHLTGLVPA